MKISCQSCQAKYTIADEKVLGKIVKIRCKKCGATIVINGNETGAQAGSSGGSGAGAGADAQAFDYSGGAGGEQWTVNVADGDQRTMTQEEIVTAFRSGVVNDETYCWKDGMADWLPIREVQELSAALSAGGGGGALGGGAASPDQTHDEPPSPAYQPPAPALEAPSYGGYGGSAAAAGNGSGLGNGTSNGLFGSAPAAARREGGRRGGGGADLFGAAAAAGGEDDVMTSAPAGMPQASSDPGKLTGQRNENSVLFSLNALTQNAPKADAPPHPGAEGSGLIDIRALSASMGNGSEKAKNSHVDDIMNLGGGGAFSAALTAPVLAPPTMEGGALGLGGEPRKDNTKMILIGIVGAGALIALAIILVVLMKKPADTAATAPTGSGAATDSTPGAATAPTAATTAPTPSATVAAADPNAGAAGGSSDSQPVAPGVGAGAVGDAHKHHGGGGGGGGGAAKATDNSPPPFVPAATPAATPASGGNSLQDLMRKSAGADTAPAAAAQTQGSSAPFDRGAAAAALGSINVASCKKSDGPTGSGHIKVTFSPSGTVQSAVVDQPPFAGTAVGGCVAGKFRSAHIPAFAGAPIPVGKSFVIE